MHKFRCPDGHEFEAKRNFYAHCPVCGKNAKRLYDETDSRSKTEETKQETKETSENPESAEEKNKQDEERTSNDTTKDGKKDSETSEQNRPNSSKPRRVKVTREETKKEDAKDDKGKSSTSTPAKKVKIKRGATPKVVKKIVTTRDRKVNKEKKEERATQWTRVKSFKIF